MALAFSSIYSSFLILVTFLAGKNAINTNHLHSSSTSHFPKLQAEKFIRDLNLFPEANVNVAAHEPSSIATKKSVKKRFKFPFRGISGPYIQELGHHAGYYRLSHSHTARMFYIFFESQNSKNDPVVIWLTGGPGCGSEMALFYENGPYQITKNLSLVWNDYSWNKASNILYIDQPIGTGFSYTTDKRDIRHDEHGVSHDLYDFLQEFFTEHPQYVNNDFYITGESYAGHYIPAIAYRVHQGNKANEGVYINLKGFAIGNGLTNPAIQYTAYTDYALSMGLINKTDYDRINKLLPECETSIRTCGTIGGGTCRTSFKICNKIFDSIIKVAGNINYYDIRKQCIGNKCYDFSNLENFLNQNSVRDSLGVGDKQYVSCSVMVYKAMMDDWMKNLEVSIPALLEDGIKVLVYAGEYDLMCNWLGNSRWAHSMKWSGQTNFSSSPTVPFIVDGTKAGLLKSYGPLAFLKFHNAGHMVPMDQPKAALEMLRSWMQGNLATSQKPDRKSLL